MEIEVRSLRSTELGNAAHLVIERDSGVAVVIDPVRDVGQYLDVATGNSVELAWALETHVHNDFVSGARELVASTATRLGASRDAELRYPYERLGDGDEIEIGSFRLRVLATPGHTPEHVAYLLIEVKREFSRRDPDRLWVTDITEHPTMEGKVYCCVVLDVFSRRVVGWSIDSHQETALVTNALGMAITNRVPTAETVIHSDQGTQFTSWAFTNRVIDAGLLAWTNASSRRGSDPGKNLRRGGTCQGFTFD